MYDFAMHAKLYPSETPDDNFEKPQWLVNQAAVGTWFGAANMPRYRLAIIAFYAAAVDGLGNTLVSTIALTLLQAQYGSESGIQNELFSSITLPDEVVTVMSKDPAYGLST